MTLARRQPLGYFDALKLAELEHVGVTSRAIVIVHEILPAIRAGRDQRNIDWLRANFAGDRLAMNGRANASAAAREAVGRNANRGEPDARQGDVERAETSEGYVDASLRPDRREHAFTVSTTRERLSALLTQRMSPDTLERLIDAGAEISPEHAIPFARGSS